jgi:hypothetical protein
LDNGYREIGAGVAKAVSPVSTVEHLRKIYKEKLDVSKQVQEFICSRNLVGVRFCYRPITTKLVYPVAGLLLCNGLVSQ